jgi:hypothetical protein
MHRQEGRLDPIATSSVEDGLDFACSLLSSAISAEAEVHPEKARPLLKELAQYIELRYVGETLLALEYLSSIGRTCNPETVRGTQFWRQLDWVADQMELSAEERQRGDLKDA